MQTITEAVGRHARQRPAGLALVDGSLRMGWGQVGAWMENTAGWLIAQGFARGAAVVGWLPNCAEWNLFRLACERAGLLFVPVPASQGKRELASILARARPVLLISRGIFRKRDYAAECEELCAGLETPPARITLDDSGPPSLAGPPAPPDAALRLEEMAHALPTSGSGGTPKLALFSLRAACRRGQASVELLGLGPDDVMLVLSHGTGPARPAWLSAPIAGAAIVALPIFSAEKALALIRAERPTIICATPAQLAMLAPLLDAAAVSGLRIWYTSGAVIAPSLAEELETLNGAPVVSTYGGADFGGWASPAPEDPPHVRRGTVGRPRGGTEFRIVNADGGDVAAGEAGELIGRGPCCVEGYLGEDGRENWRDGWFYTGDLARIEPGGNVVIVGRLKSVIIRGGHNVLPVEVEACLRSHPAVGEVAVVGVPDEILGERVCACVVPKEGGKVALEELRAHLRGQGLAHYKAPERLLLLDALPMVSDKVDQRALAALLANRAPEG